VDAVCHEREGNTCFLVMPGVTRHPATPHMYWIPVLDQVQDRLCAGMTNEESTHRFLNV
jgi:hypothetical protein